VVGDGPDWLYEIYSWQALVLRVKRWLEEVKHDLKTPDLWAELKREAERRRRTFLLLPYISLAAITSCGLIISLSSCSKMWL
jgi:hypothetical protein